jgi:glucokinase
MATVAVFNDKQEMALAVKEMARICLSEATSPRILFPTGTTPLGDDGFFAALVHARHNEHLETERIRLVSGDEYYGISIDDPGSFATYLRTQVVEPLGINLASAHILDGNTADSTSHCIEFENSLCNDPCSLAVLGLGTNGHVAFNDPPSAASSVTRRLCLTASSLAASKSVFSTKTDSELPKEALSVGLSTLTRHSRACCVLAVGKKKADIVKQVLEGEASPDCPASQLRDAANFIFCLDVDAASTLSSDTIRIDARGHHPVEVARRLFAKTSKVIVNGDVGGTNARMQMWDVLGSGATMLRCDIRYGANEFNSGGQLIEHFLSDSGTLRTPEEQVHALCLALCGPILNENEQAGVILPEQGPTGWGLNMKELLDGPLQNRVKKAKLVNDFVAVGLGVTAMPESQIITLHAARLGEEPHATKAAVGAGTGLGAVFMTRDPTHGHYLSHASEGGTAEFSAQTETQWKLRSFIKERDPAGHCTVEGVLSGPGLVNVFYFFNSLKAENEQSRILDGLSREDSPARIVEGVAQKDEICVQTLDMFIECLACHLRLTAMHFLPTGGLYICGGIPCRPVVIDRIKELLSPGFFIEDPVMGEFLNDRVSLKLIDNPDCGLLGARIRAERLLRE